MQQGDSHEGYASRRFSMASSGGLMRTGFVDAVAWLHGVEVSCSIVYSAYDDELVVARVISGALGTTVCGILIVHDF